MSTPTVTVVMNCFNGAEHLREAIDSVYRQTYADWEIVFWDDGSTDNSPAIAQSYNDGRLRYFRDEARLPMYGARNQALKRARGEFIGFLDCDDIWLPRKLDAQLARFRSVNSEQLALVYSNLEILDLSGRRYRWYDRDQPSGRIFSGLLKRYHLMLPSVLIRRSVVEAIGAFNETLTMSGDSELFLRIARDWELAYEPTVSAVYREHNTNMSRLRTDLFLREAIAVISGLADGTPEFHTRFANEVTSYLARRQKAYAVGLWQNGFNREARGLAATRIASLVPMIALWLLSFLPYDRIQMFRSGTARRWWRQLKP